MKAIIISNLKAIVTFIKASFKLIGDIFHTLGDLLHGRWGRLWGDIRNLVGDTLSAVVAMIKAAPIVNAVIVLAGRAYAAAKRLGSNIKNGIVDGLSGAASAVGGAIRQALNSAIGMMNSGLGKIASVVNKIPGVHMPSSIPLLAGGGVINSPTLAFVGESIASRPEIVTPERLLRRIMREEGGGRAGRQALVITNWHEGTGYIASISDLSVAGAGQLARQRSRMRR